MFNSRNLLIAFIETNRNVVPVCNRFSSTVSSSVLKTKTRSEFRKIIFPEPVFDLHYACNPANAEEISDNITRRHSKGSIKRILELSNLLKQHGTNSKEYEDTEKELLSEVAKLPNRSHPAILKRGDKPEVIKNVGNKRVFDFKFREFSELSKHLRVTKSENLSKFTGHRSYFLMGQLADLESALVKFSIKNLLSRNFQLISVPDILDRSVIESCGMATKGDRNQVYTLNAEHYGPDFCLSGTSEMAIAGFLMNKTLEPNDLPLRLAAVSRCYRAETSRTAEERGIFRVHQFTKVEMFGVSEPDRSGELLEEFRAIQESAFEQLDLHFQVLDMPPYELGAQASRKYDIEAWMPGRGAYGEISSCSDCTDYQSRRLAIKIGSDGRFAHTVNGTACAAPRLIIALVENHQNKDGTIRLPSALQPFMDGATAITRNSTFPKFMALKPKEKSR